MNSSKNKVNSKSSSNIVNKELKNNLTKIKSKKIKKIKEEKILIGNKKRTNNKFNKRFNFDLDLIDDNSIKFNFLSKKEFSNNNNSNNFSHLSSFEQNNEKISKNMHDNINSNNKHFYDNTTNKNFNNDLINKLKGIKIKDQIYKNENIKEINSDLLKNISLNIDRGEQELNKIYQDYYNEKNNEIEILKEKGIQSYKNYIELKKILKSEQNEYLENNKNYEKLKNEINKDLQNEIDNNNNYLKNNSNKTLNELFFSLSFKESDYFNNNKFINNNNINNINNTKKNIKDNDLETMVEILSSLPTDKIDILKGLTNLEKQDAVLIINSNLNKDLEEKNLLNNENYNFDENENKTENEDSSEDQESNTIIQIIEKCVNSYYNRKLIPKIQIEQIDTYHYTFENLKIELALDPDKENNLITSDGENFETWLVKNFAS